jgi:hypothetical protein
VFCWVFSLSWYFYLRVHIVVIVTAVLGITILFFLILDIKACFFPHPLLSAPDSTPIHSFERYNEFGNIPFIRTKHINKSIHCES